MKTLLLIALMAFGSLTMKAVTLPTDTTICNLTTAGTLSSIINGWDKTNQVLNLKITGSIDVRDIYFISTWFKNLKSVDLSEANIVAFSGTVVIYANQYYAFSGIFEANVYPNFKGKISACYGVTSLILPNSVTEIADSALNFYHRSGYVDISITKFTLHKNIAKLGSKIFDYDIDPQINHTLTDLITEIPDPTKISCDVNAFWGLDTINCTLHVPVGSKLLYKKTAPWSSFRHILDGTEMQNMIDRRITVATAGTLHTYFSSNEKDLIKTLVVDGFIDVRDIYYLSTQFYYVTSIDLSNAIIVGYDGVVNPTLIRGNDGLLHPTLGGTFADNFYPNVLLQSNLGMYPYLTNFAVPKSTTEIESGALGFCRIKDYSNGNVNYSSLLKTFTMPANITKLNWSKLGLATALSDLTSEIIDPTKIDLGESFPWALNGYGAHAFDSVDTINCILHVPYGTKSVYQSTIPWKSFQNIVESNIIPTKINNIISSSKISIYPNPCTNSLHINAVGAVEITNMSGAVVKMVDLLENESVDVSDLSKGVYFVRVGQSVCKLVKE